eukprot:SAG11_NODE_24564_length_371_cov_1.327206_1_plen_35_part_01
MGSSRCAGAWYGEASVSLSSFFFSAAAGERTAAAF